MQMLTFYKKNVKIIKYSAQTGLKRTYFFSHLNGENKLE